jgi:hypothetical protein
MWRMKFFISIILWCCLRGWLIIHKYI